MNPTERRDFDERFFGVSFRPPVPAAAPAAPAASSRAAQGAPGAAAAGARPAEQAPGTGDDSGADQHEPGQERQSNFDPRRPGKSWRAWRKHAAAAQDARRANPGPQTFAEAAWEQAMRTSDTFYSRPNPLEAKHRRTPESAARRQVLAPFFAPQKSLACGPPPPKKPCMRFMCTLSTDHSARTHAMARSRSDARARVRRSGSRRRRTSLKASETRNRNVLQCTNSGFIALKWGGGGGGRRERERERQKALSGISLEHGAQ